ncbi:MULTISPECIES: hypothetical protein [unclassified Fusobacterium]|uniref:hypothetical protein n=1 Tax=unclassified Fusobacterium TaxID=2648384 RepID=UPI001B8D039B|nr:MULTISPECIES: hypothetical protein [unclassified Fusobacterium]MBR8702212.1 hypothetical protein [Fusobacterium sp. DD45]MBR8712029.1 hypothetical protein [Fusobacterium sp. DD28]MBR8752609.1 hypothetical protein [Fusobacterium sp. DD26]
MPLPFLLFAAAPAVTAITAELVGAGVVAATGVAVGTKKLFDSEETYKKAHAISKDAERKYEREKANFDKKMENTKKTLDNFEKDQLEILKSFEEFVRLVKILHKEAVFYKIDAGYKFEPVKIEELEEISIAADVISGVVCSGIKGVITELSIKGTVAQISKIIAEATGKQALNLMTKEAVRGMVMKFFEASVCEGIGVGAANGFAAGMGTGAASGFAAGMGTGAASGSAAGMETGAASGFAAGMGTGVASGFAAGMGTGVASGFVAGIGTGAASGFATGIGVGATAGSSVGPLGVGIGAGVGAIYSGYSLEKSADSTLKKSRKIETLADEAIKNMDKIISYVDDLVDTTEKYKMVMSATKKVYDKELDKLKSVISKKTNYDRFTPEESLLLENTSLLVKLLYQMCKIKLVKKGENGEQQVNKNDINIIEMETINYLEKTGEHDTLMAAYEKK